MEAHYYIDDKTPTGTCAVLVNSGDRSLVANLAAANNFVPAHLETERAKAMVESAKFYYIASFFLTVSVDSILQIAKPAAESGKVCVGWVCMKREKKKGGGDVNAMCSGWSFRCLFLCQFSSVSSAGGGGDAGMAGSVGFLGGLWVWTF